MQELLGVSDAWGDVLAGGVRGGAKAFVLLWHKDGDYQRVAGDGFRLL